MEELNLDRKVFNKEYVEKKVKMLIPHEVYWCLYYLYDKYPEQNIFLVKDDRNCKKKLISYLEIKMYSPIKMDKLLLNMSNNIIPKSYMSWFYEKNIPTLWFIMVLKHYDYKINYITTFEEIMIENHNIIYSKSLYAVSKKIIDPTQYYIETTTHQKISALVMLRDIFIPSKVKDNDLKWLDRKDSRQIDWAYEYMFDSYLGASNYIYFDVNETISRYDHIVASFDYMVFDQFKLTTIRSPVSLDHCNFKLRTNFINTMKNTWQKRKSRLNKNTGSNLNINKTNKKILKSKVINERAIKSQVFSDISVMCNKNIHTKAFKWKTDTANSSTGNYGKTHLSTFETMQSVEAKHNSSQAVLEDTTSSNSCKDADCQIKASQLAPSIEESGTENSGSSETKIDIEQTRSDEQAKALESVDDSPIDHFPDKPIVVIAKHWSVERSANISSVKTNKSSIELQPTENKLASDVNSDCLIQEVDENDPFQKNARIRRERHRKTILPLK